MLTSLLTTAISCKQQHNSKHNSNTKLVPKSSNEPFIKQQPNSNNKQQTQQQTQQQQQTQRQ
jgi:hypothetical protein